MIFPQFNTDPFDMIWRMIALKKFWGKKWASLEKFWGQKWVSHFSCISCFSWSRVFQKYSKWVLVGCGIEFPIQRILPIKIWVKPHGDKLKIRVEKVVYFFFSSKIWWGKLILFYYFHYYFIIFLKRPILDLKIPLMTKKTLSVLKWWPGIKSHVDKFKIHVQKVVFSLVYFFTILTFYSTILFFYSKKWWFIPYGWHHHLDFYWFL